MKFSFPTPNGILLQEGEKQVCSLIDPSGNKKLKSLLTKNKIIFWHFPFFRGVQFFFCGLFALISAQTLSSNICFKKKDKSKDNFILLLIIAISLGISFSLLFLGYFPTKIGYAIIGFDGDTLFRNFIILLFRLFFFFSLISFLRIFPTMCELFRFNTATLNFDKTKKSKSQNAPNILNFSILVFFFHFVVLTLCGASFGFWLNTIFQIGIFLLVISITFEISLIILNSKLKFLRWFTLFLIYQKPSRTHFETLNIAKTELNFLTTQKGRTLMQEDDKKPFSIVYSEVKSRLERAGITDKSDAEWLIATILGKNRAEVKLVQSITEKQYADILKATDRRAKGESLDNIFGYTEFYGLRFDVNKKVLTPRMETELLVEQVLKAEKNYKKCTILDIGTGSGAIAITLSKNCDSSITAVDISKPALATAESNAKKLGAKVEFLHSNLFDGLKRKRKFDIIVSNPPYIKSDDIEKLDKNVKDCDPHIALDGGEDGLDFYKKITQEAPKHLTIGGMLFYEIGKGQGAAVRKLLRENGFEEIKTIKDYNKIERIICGKLK